MIFEKLKKLRRKDQIQDGGSTTWLGVKVNSRICVDLLVDTISEDFRKLYQLWKIGNFDMKSMLGKERLNEWTNERKMKELCHEMLEKSGMYIFKTKEVITENIYSLLKDIPQQVLQQTLKRQPFTQLNVEIFDCWSILE